MAKNLFLYLVILLIFFILIFKSISKSEFFYEWAIATVNSATIVSVIFIWILNGKVESLKEKYNKIKNKIGIKLLAEEGHIEGIVVAKNYLELLLKSSFKFVEIEELHEEITGHFTDYLQTYDFGIKEDLIELVKFLKKINIKKVCINDKVRESSISNMRQIIRLLEKNQRLKKIDINKIREKTEEALLDE